MKCALPKLGSLFFGHGLTVRQNPTVRLLSLGAVVLITAGFGFAWRCSATGADQRQSSAVARPLPVDTVAAKPVDAYELRRTYTGTLVAGRSSDLSSPGRQDVIHLGDCGVHILNADQRLVLVQPIAQSLGDDVDFEIVASLRAQVAAEIQADGVGSLLLRSFNVAGLDSAALRLTCQGQGNEQGQGE